MPKHNTQGTQGQCDLKTAQIAAHHRHRTARPMLFSAKSRATRPHEQTKATTRRAVRNNYSTVNGSDGGQSLLQSKNYLYLVTAITCDFTINSRCSNSAVTHFRFSWRSSPSVPFKEKTRSPAVLAGSAMLFIAEAGGLFFSRRVRQETERLQIRIKP
jgi:hypothetical protein